jgi:Tfp pilus assembly protein PilX
MSNNQKGLGAVVILLILVVVGIIGGTGWFVYNSQKKTTRSLDNTNKSTSSTTIAEKTAAKSPVDPYDGWKAYMTKYEKMSFKYPSDLTLTDTSHASVANQDNVTPGLDTIKLVGASGFAISIQTGLEGIGGGCPECTIDFYDPVTVAGTNYNINYVNSGSGKISSVTVSKIHNDFIGSLDGKNITINGSTNKAATIISASFHSGDNIIEKTLEQYKADHFVMEFKLLVESISY